MANFRDAGHQNHSSPTKRPYCPFSTSKRASSVPLALFWVLYACLMAGCAGSSPAQSAYVLPSPPLSVPQQLHGIAREPTAFSFHGFADTSASLDSFPGPGLATRFTSIIAAGHLAQQFFNWGNLKQLDTIPSSIYNQSAGRPNNTLGEADHVSCVLALLRLNL